MSNLKLAVLGAGWWSTSFQIPAWLEFKNQVDLVAVCDRDLTKAQAIAERLHIPHAYAEAEAVFEREKPDFVDIVASIPAHEPLVNMAARYEVPVICQKPMGPDYAACQRMVQTCSQAGIPFLVHENTRWQAGFRAMKRLMDSGAIGAPFRAKIVLNDYDNFTNQPYMKVERRLTIADTGSHTLDVIRFFFGEAQEIYCRTQRIRSDIAGEDVATIMLRCGDVTVLNELSNSTHMYDAYTQMIIEGTAGTLELLTEHRVRLTTVEGTRIERHVPPVYAWSQGAHPWLTSIVPCHANLLQAIQAGNASLAETNSVDNLKTMRLVYAAYDSADRNELIMCS